jgi:hypothetical protein
MLVRWVSYLARAGYLAAIKADAATATPAISRARWFFNVVTARRP